MAAVIYIRAVICWILHAATGWSISDVYGCSDMIKDSEFKS